MCSLRKQKGFSLVELMVTIGLMGVVSLITIRIMENQSAAQLSVEASAEINTTVSLIAQAINDPNKCNQMFRGRNINSVVTELRYQINTTIPPSDAFLLQSRNSGKIYQYFYIDDGDMTLSQDSANTGTANLNIAFNVQSMAKSQKINLFDHLNSRTVRRQIPFNVITDGSLNIVSCGPVVSRSNEEARKTACDSLPQNLARWNPATASCELRPYKCGFGNIPVNFDITGRVTCRSASTQIPVEDIFDMSHVVSCADTNAGAPGLVSFWGITVTSAGKLGINCWGI